MAKEIDPSDAAKALGRLGGLKGGKARMEALSPERRTEIARQAVQARWAKTKDIPKATHTGVLKIGDVELSCAVLEDGTRVLTQEGFLHAIGRAKKAKGGEGASVDGLPAFLRAENLKDFIPKDLEESTRPVVFKPFKGPGYRGIAYGYRAELLPQVCRVYIFFIAFAFVNLPEKKTGALMAGEVTQPKKPAEERGSTTRPQPIRDTPKPKSGSGK